MPKIANEYNSWFQKFHSIWTNMILMSYWENCHQQDTNMLGSISSAVFSMVNSLYVFTHGIEHAINAMIKTNTFCRIRPDKSTRSGNLSQRVPIAGNCACGLSCTWSTIHIDSPSVVRGLRYFSTQER